MLVLSRKKGESIIIGEDIELMIISVEGDTVRLGINAPKHVEIMRKEILVSVQENNQTAAINVEQITEFMSERKKEK
ncbi:carbon storage regulator CsrA [Saccharibacillus kuerlensis]|uniref:Translational regulator CsrA n=1 Tax=Saccharibacillus kuerlensis TaxID=459527 RepID=A0ABQ2KUJ9_9BACL|nr:carbon storage regulator CsrA [Saccharibacillus kuerlensis]GGN93238.1 carbon storage regulator [Saccharibacillus kuerlensis]